MKTAIIAVLIMLAVVLAALPAAAQEGGANTAAQDLPGATAAGDIGRVLIVHDQDDDDLLPGQLASLLGHFFVTTEIVEEEFYEPGSLAAYDAVFYIGGTHKAINPAFLEDIYASEKPVAWMGRGLDWLNAEYPLDKYGIGYSRVETAEPFTQVSYKDTDLRKTDPVASVTYVADEGRAEVLSWMDNGSESAPYLVHGGNFWYFADIPMFSNSPEGASGDSAYLVLADVLHDILNQPHPEEHRAMVRIEDVHPMSDISKLDALVDYLYQKRIPFGVGLIPVYINPGTGEEVHLSDRPEFVEAIKRAETKGGTIVLHGYTHQLYGVTAIDHEFYDNRTGTFPSGESVESISSRIETALAEVNEQGIYPRIWETPHYNASDLTHSVVAEYFDVVWERRDAPFFPYVVQLEKTDQIGLPETLGYIRGADRTAEKLVSMAAKQKVVRDGYASFFFHLHIEEGQMHEMVDGLQAQGYDFVSPAVAGGLPYTPPPPPSWVSRVAWRVTQTMGAFLPQSLKDPSGTTLLTLLAIMIIIYYWGIFLLSRKPPKLKGVFNPDLAFVIIIPALNEEMVLGKTLDHLLSLPQDNLTVLVVNDNSDDRTLEIANSFRDKRLRVINHPEAEAQQGKGRVLNFAFKYLMASDLVREKGADNVIYGVLDADGRVQSNILEAVNPYFSKPDVGAVQTGVRINNANTNILTKWQNFEFLAFARLAQKAREHLGSVGLGGNGQFVRLSALASRGDDPWTDCLTEDLDLGINLMLAGWENHYCSDTFISQQGVPEMRPLIKQRTRWFQGHMTCWRHIPALASLDGPLSARIDTIYYLLAPLMVFIFLPSSLLFVFWTIFFILSGASSVIVDPVEFFPTAIVWYIFSFGAVPTVVWTFWREEKEMSGVKAFIYAHVFAFFYVVWFVAGVKAIYRLARGEGSWVKTARSDETAAGKVGGGTLGSFLKKS